MRQSQEKISHFHADGFDVTWQSALEINGVNYPFSAGRVEQENVHSIKSTFIQVGVEWVMEISRKEDEIRIKSTITNNGDSAVHLGKILLFQSDELKFGAAGDDVIVLPWKPGQQLQSVYRLGDVECPPLSKINAQFYNCTAKRALQIGFLTFQRANTEVLFTADKNGDLQSLSAYCDFANWELQPQKSASTEIFRLTVGDNPYAQMEDWAQQAAVFIHPRIWDEAPIGYIGWSWVDCIHGERNYEEVTLETLDAINRRLGGFGVKYLWTSMNNVEGSLPGKWLDWNTRCIPSGRKKFIRSVQNKGFIQGFWIGPFYLCSSLTDLMEEFSDAILQNLDGTPMVVCPEWRHGDAGLMPRKDRPRLYALDPSHPKVLSYIQHVFETYREWGVRYYMVDFLEAGAGNAHRFPYKTHFDQSLVAGPEAYANFIRTMKKAGGEDAYFLVSTGPTMLNAGLQDGVRTGNDFGEGRALSPEAFFYPATYVINTLGFWTGPGYALTNQAANYHTHRKLYLNDSGNVLTVDQPIPLSHARIHATIHALSGGATMLGDDIRVMSEERLNLIKKTLPRTRDIAKPLDLFDAPHPSSPKIFYRKITTDWQNYDVFAIYNLSAEPVKHEFILQQLGLDDNQEYLVWEFWNEKFVDKVKSTFSTWVEAESVQVLRFARNVDAPALLGTDMHVLMGEMEIETAVYDADEMVFSLIAKRPASESGVAFIHAPDNVYIKNFDGLHIAKDGRDNSLVIGVPLQFDESGKATREIYFGNLQEVLDMSKLDLA